MSVLVARQWTGWLKCVRLYRLKEKAGGGEGRRSALSAKEETMGRKPYEWTPERDGLQSLSGKHV